MAEEHNGEKWWHTPWEFLVHALVGTLIFLIIATPAVGLDFLIKWLASQDVSDIIIYGLKGAEYALFFVDLVLFVVFLVRTAWVHAKKMIDPTKKGDTPEETKEEPGHRRLEEHLPDEMIGHGFEEKEAAAEGEEIPARKKKDE